MALLLIRHGQSEGNARGIVQGRLDLPLTNRGREQGRRLAQRLRSEGGVERLVASPLARAFETAEVISEAFDLPIATDERLMEYDFGEVSGLSWPQIAKRYPEIIAAQERGERPKFPGEEGRETFDARIVAVLDELVGDQAVVAVAHGGVVNTAVRAALGLLDEQRQVVRTENCSITELARDLNGRLVLRRHNDACHVSGLF